MDLTHCFTIEVFTVEVFPSDLEAEQQCLGLSNFAFTEGIPLLSLNLCFCHH